MNIRKHWKRLLFSVTTLFWASCGGDSENSPVLPNNIGSETPSSSSVVTPTSSAGITESSSSETPISSVETASSSSTTISSSSSAKLYKLASDTTITCTESAESLGWGCLLYDSPNSKSGPSSAELQEILKNNKTRTLEELDAIEDTLENIPEFEMALDYGIPYCVRPEIKYSFKCSNDKSIVVHDPDENVLILRDTLHHRGEYLRENREGEYIYTLEEYFKKFVSSSSSAPESSSSSVEPPSPLCTKDEFVNYHKLDDTYSETKEHMADSVKASLSEEELESKTACLNKIQTKDKYFQGVVASKQICNGDTIVNPRYQARLDSNKVYIQEQIDECLKDKQ